MSAKTLKAFQQLVDTEDYLQFFEIPYDQHLVNVNRLHILKKFSELIKEIDEVFPELPEGEKLAKYQEAFARAYALFQTTSPLETKLFKVFQNKPKNVVLLETLTNSLGVQST